MATNNCVLRGAMADPILGRDRTNKAFLKFHIEWRDMLGDLQSVPCICWGKQAESLSNGLATEGREVIITGYLKANSDVGPSKGLIQVVALHIDLIGNKQVQRGDQ